MNPEYFMHTLCVWELELFTSGLARRQQQAWERARYQSFYAAAPQCKNFKFEDLGQFPWEKDDAPIVSEEEQMKEIEDLRALARVRDEKLLNAMRDGNR